MFVRMTDSFLSDWGICEGKINVLVIECYTLEQAENIFRASKRRSEMKHVQICLNRPKNRSNVLYTNKHYNQMGEIWKQ